MFKRTLLAVAIVAASTTMAMTTDLDPGTPPVPANDAACHSTASPDAGCALRILDPNGEGASPATDLATLAAAPPALELTPPRPPRDTGLDFKDAATDSVSVLHASLDLDTRRPLIPALLALGALVVLLRQRPL